MAFFSYDLNENAQILDKVFEGCADIKMQDVCLEYMGESRGRIYFVEEAVSQVTIRKVMLGLTDVSKIYDPETAIDCVFSGNALILLDGKKYALKVRSEGYTGLGVQEAKDEQVLRGSNEGFSDSYKKNQMLIRKRIRSADLKIEETKTGSRSNTGVAILYMEGIARRSMLREIKRRLKTYKVDGVMDSGVVEQLTSENAITPFPQYLVTGRPDRAAMSLLAGQIVVLVDNSPTALVFPVNVGTFLETADDYYSKWNSVSIARIIRHISVYLAMSLPAIYVAIMEFSPEILPSDLITIFANARIGIPYPVVVEVLLLELAFELIKEAGIRIPGAMGSTMGIVGGLIVGSAAVDANLASPIIVIIVALTALCEFSIPNEEFSAAIRILKYFLIILSAMWGIYGYIWGMLAIGIHLASLESYGFPYLGPVAAGDANGYEDEKDFIIRAPIKKIFKRPIFSRKENRIRVNFDDKDRSKNE